MTNEDLQQIRAVVREEVAAAVHAEVAAVVHAEVAAVVHAEVAAAEQRITAATTANLSDLREEMITRFDRLDRRMERVENNCTAQLVQTAGFSKSLTEAERIDSETAVTLAAQRRAIAELAARVAALEAQQNGKS